MIPTECGCALPLDAKNITGICAECRHIARDARAGFIAQEVSNLDEARTNFVTVFPIYRPQSADAIYMRGACRVCGTFRARHDTGKCEWHSRPWTPRPPKRTKKKPARKKATA